MKAITLIILVVLLSGVRTVNAQTWAHFNPVHHTSHRHWQDKIYVRANDTISEWYDCRCGNQYWLDYENSSLWLPPYIDSCLKKIKEKPAEYSSYWLLAFMYSTKTRYGILKADSVLLSYLSVNSEKATSTFYNDRALLYELAKDTATAIIYYKKSLELDNSSFFPYFNLGRMYENNQLDTAYTYYLKAKSINEKRLPINDPVKRVSSKIIIRDQRSTMDSIRLFFDKAYFLDTVQKQYELARIYDMFRQRDSAQAYYHKVLISEADRSVYDIILATRRYLQLEHDERNLNDELERIFWNYYIKYKNKEFIEIIINSLFRYGRWEAPSEKWVIAFITDFPGEKNEWIAKNAERNAAYIISKAPNRKTRWFGEKKIKPIIDSVLAQMEIALKTGASPSTFRKDKKFKQVIKYRKTKRLLKKYSGK